MTIMVVVINFSIRIQCVIHLVDRVASTTLLSLYLLSFFWVSLVVQRYRLGGDLSVLLAYVLERRIWSYQFKLVTKLTI